MGYERHGHTVIYFFFLGRRGGSPGGGGYERHLPWNGEQHGFLWPSALVLFAAL